MHLFRRENEVKEWLEIYDCLSGKDRQGLSVLTLSRELNLPVSTVNKCLSKFGSVFSRVGNSDCYSINRLRSASDPRKLLIQEVAKREREQACFWLSFCVFVQGVVVYVSVVSFGGA